MEVTLCSYAPMSGIVQLHADGTGTPEADVFLLNIVSDTKYAQRTSVGREILLQHLVFQVRNKATPRLVTELA